MYYKLVLSLVCVFDIMAQEAAAPPGRQWGKQSGSFQLSIGANRENYSAGEPVIVTAALKNVVDSPDMVTRLTPDTLYEITVYVPIAGWIPLKPQADLTAYGRSHTRAALSDPTPSTRFMGLRGFFLDPGKELLDHFDLNMLYQISSPGEYRVTFSCTLPSRRFRGSTFTITSNDIKFTILPKQP